MPASKGPAPRFPTHLHSFHELMQYHVGRILLVSSLYDSFILSEEGQLQETLLGHFIELNLSNAPNIIQASGAREALELLAEDSRFDLVISGVQAGDRDVVRFTRDLRAAGHDMPVLALAYTNRDLQQVLGLDGKDLLDRIFLWQGDVRLFLAMVKYVEDRANVPHDAGRGGVPVILVVEDNVRYYSSFLPSIYTEIYRHTHQLLVEGLNASQKLLRMRARPKVLLCTSFEEAWDAFERYTDEVLGVISDFEYPHDGRMDPRAGLELCKRALERRPGLRLVLQSSRPENEALAKEIGASFLLKGSPLLLHDLRATLVQRFGFGDFVFRTPDGTEVASASDLRTFAKALRKVPIESLVHHANHDHFSCWLKARTEFALSERVAGKTADDFESPEDLRAYLLRVIDHSRLERQRTVITDFDRKNFEPTVSITRIGGGSLGGKARGVAFANRILRSSGIDQRFTGIDIYVPPSVVLRTDVYDEFIEYEGIKDYALGARTDQEVTARLLEAPFPRGFISDIRAFLQHVKYPLAVRSSSLLEDSLSQPFAGVYRTYMLPNNEFELDRRWLRLSEAIKRVYASAFLEQAKAYLSMTSYRLEEEKMAVMIQELVGRRHGDRFYPDFSGVARSYNFYPEPGHSAEDGVAAVALGMGQAVVGGGPCLRFCPRYPRQLVSFSSVEDALENSQREFYALDLDQRTTEPAPLSRYGLEQAEEDGTLRWIASTYCPDDHRIVDGISRAGVRLISFAHVLKHGAFPLAELLSELLVCCSQGAGAPVEIEFAGNFGIPGKTRPRFAFLQMRPMSLSREESEVTIPDYAPQELLCRSTTVLGNGRISDVRDIVMVDVQTFDRQRSHEVALEVARFDALLRKDGRPYLLIGVGRWGSSDPHLGITVGWNQISGARVIVEAGFRDFRVEPSQGTHFFQNLTSSGVGYLTVNPDLGEGEIDWDWLRRLEAFEERESVRHLRLDQPLDIILSGRTGEAVILKPRA